MVLEIARADFALKWLFLTIATPKPMPDGRMDGWTDGWTDGRTMLVV